MKSSASSATTRSATTSGAFAGQPQCAARSQTGRKFPLQGTPSLNIKRLIDGFVADPHGCVLRKVHFQTLRDLFRAPGTGPAPTLPMNGPSPFPYHNRTIEGDATRRSEKTGQTVLHIIAQGWVARQLAWFWALCCTIRMLLRRNRAVVKVAPTCRGVTPDLPRYSAG